jgi:thioredoxin 1
MSKEVVELNSKNFDDFIAKGNCVVDFWAEWCGPCKMLKPIFENTAKEMKGKVKFGKINVENEQELAERFMVMSIPALLFFKSGENVERLNGAVPKEDIIKAVNRVF